MVGSINKKGSRKEIFFKCFELKIYLKKTEWSREEDEKLLHAAKIMPCQWRSISTIVGRTAAQCLERYEKLLDSATQEGTIDEDPRKLKAGEIDTHPETKPALPDAIDMEEDEKEMLQEARARMANTNGKKIKRKAREKQLEEARRLAMLQRRRELKAAGIGGYNKRVKGIDYNKEVPFLHKPAPGFYDATEELMKPPPPVDFKEMTQKTRVVRKDFIEERLRKNDIERENERLRNDPVAALEELNKAAEARRSSIRKISSLNLPEPQLTEEEMRELAKIAYEPEFDQDASKGSEATKSLLSSYSVAQTTPQLNKKGSQTPSIDPIMIEASNQAKLRQLQTPLVGGENPVLNESGLANKDWKSSLSTPNPLTALKPSVTSKQTPSRDQLGLNTPQITSYESRQELKAHKLSQKNRLSNDLSSLPAPKYSDFVIEIGEDNELKESKENDNKITDRSDLKKAEIFLLQKKNELIQSTRSTPVKRQLPRPSKIPFHYVISTDPAIEELEVQALQLIENEMITILTNDCIHFPNPGNPPYKIPEDWNFETFNDYELERAKSILDSELQILNSQKPTFNFENFSHHWSSIVQKILIPIDLGNNPSNEPLIKQYKLIESENKSLESKIENTLKKLTIYQGGYEKRCSSLEKEIFNLFKQLNESNIDLQSFEKQLEREKIALPQRLNELQNDVKKVSDREKILQLRYQELLEQRDSLKAKLIQN